MSEERSMTIKRAMTRCKTIKAQLNDITEKIREHGAISDKQKHMLGDTTLSNSAADLKLNHRQAREKVESLFQKFYDLQDEFIKIKLAIDKANAENTITIGDKTMTLREALVFKDKTGITPHLRQLSSYFKQSVANASQVAQRHNMQYSNVAEENKQALLADVELMVDPKRIEQLDHFLIEFVNEVDGTLDEAIGNIKITF